ncbi:MAG: hypothetical protein ACPGYS_04320 [Flavobacteriales bacterium]
MSAHYLCDSHVVKLAVEEVQMLTSALLNNGAPAGYMPETKRGTIHRGGYRNHPMTRWTGESKANFDWAMTHAQAICDQFRLRYDKEHFAQKQLAWIRDAVFHDKWEHYKLRDYIPNGPLTPFPRCVNQSQGRNLDLLDESKYTTVQAYRTFYIREKRGFAKWDKTPLSGAPYWWPVEE